MIRKRNKLELTEEIKKGFTKLAYGLFFFTLGVWGWAFIIINGFIHESKALLFFIFYLSFLWMFQAILSFHLLDSSKSIRKQGKKGLTLYLITLIAAIIVTGYFFFLEV